MRLRLGHSLSALRPTLHNGPGWRVGLWVQGCVHRCTDRCLSPHLLDPAGGAGFDVADVREAIARAASAADEPVEGVTVLGGEPFEQAPALAELLGPLRASGLSVMVYSGHTLEGLRRMGDPGIDALLAQTDLLVDGPYLPHLYSERVSWRGSTNQRLLRLTPRYTADDLEAAEARQGKAFSIEVGGGQVSISGLQTREGITAVVDALGLSRPSPAAAPPTAPPKTPDPERVQA